MHRHADLTVTDLPKRARVLTLHPRRTLPVLREPHVIEHPHLDADHRCDPLRARPHKQRRIPRRVGQKLLHRLVPRPVFTQPKQGRLQTLPAPVLDQTAHIQPSVLPLTLKRQPARDLAHKPDQTLTHLRHHPLNLGRRLKLKHSLHRHPPQTMPIDTDTVRRKDTGPFNQLTKHY